MNERFGDDDLDTTEDDRVLDALDAVRAAYVSDRLPTVGGQLAAVFAHGLPEREGRSEPIREPARSGRKLRRFVPSRAILAGLGAAVVSINLAAVGAAGLLPGPLQSSFDRVTRTLGVDVPGAVRGERPSTGTPDHRPAGPPEPTATDAPRGGATPQGSTPARGPAGRGGQDQPPREPPAQPGNAGTARPPGTDRPSPSPTPAGTLGPTSRPAAPGGPNPQGSVPTTAPCIAPPAPGPTLPPVPSVPTTVALPLPAGPSTTLPLPPPACPR